MGAGMELHWHISKADIRGVQCFVERHRGYRFVQDRTERNLAPQKPEVGCAEFWKHMVGARLTSVQRSGPNSPVARFLTSDPFPLSFEAAADADGPDEMRNLFKRKLSAHGGIRFSNKIASDLSNNFAWLTLEDNWATTLQKVNSLAGATNTNDERMVARFIHQKFHGFGPKQSRNLLQSLGLTKYEIPIDSRIIKWLRGFGFPAPLSPEALTDSEYYEFVLDGIQKLCAACNLHPCIVDAAIFASYDGDAWAKKSDI